MRLTPAWAPRVVPSVMMWAIQPLGAKLPRVLPPPKAVTRSPLTMPGLAAELQLVRERAPQPAAQLVQTQPQEWALE